MLFLFCVSCHHFCAAIRSCKGSPLDLIFRFPNLVGNVFWYLLFSPREISTRKYTELAITGGRINYYHYLHYTYSQFHRIGMYQLDQQLQLKIANYPNEWELPNWLLKCRLTSPTLTHLLQLGSIQQTIILLVNILISHSDVCKYFKEKSVLNTWTVLRCVTVFSKVIEISQIEF